MIRKDHGRDIGLLLIIIGKGGNKPVGILHLAIFVMYTLMPILRLMPSE